MADLKLGLAQGYWGAAPNPNFVEMAQEAEKLGFDSVWSAEAWGSDAITPLAWILARTTKLKAGTAICQVPARTPANIALRRLGLSGSPASTTRFANAIASACSKDAGVTVSNPRSSLMTAIAPQGSSASQRLDRRPGRHAVRHEVREADLHEVVHGEPATEKSITVVNEEQQRANYRRNF